MLKPVHTDQLEQQRGPEGSLFYIQTVDFHETHSYIMPQSASFIGRMSVAANGELMPFEALRATGSEIAVSTHRPLSDTELFLWTVACRGIKAGLLPFVHTDIEKGDYHIAVTPDQERVFYSRWGFDWEAGKEGYIIEGLGEEQITDLKKLIEQQAQSSLFLQKAMRIEKTRREREAWIEKLYKQGFNAVNFHRLEKEFYDFRFWSGLPAWRTPEPVNRHILAAFDLTTS